MTINKPATFPTLAPIDMVVKQPMGAGAIASHIADLIDDDRPIEAVKVLLDMDPDTKIISLPAAKWIIDRFRWEYVSDVEDGTSPNEHAVDRLECRIQALQAIFTMPKRLL